MDPNPPEVDAYCRHLEAYLCRKNDGHLIRIIGPAFEQVCGWAARATSIETELGRPADRNLLLVECLAALASRYAELRGGRGAAIVDAWRARAAVTLRRPVEWDVEGSPQRGIARDIDDTGALLVDTPGGVARIVSGEVRWVG